MEVCLRERRYAEIGLDELQHGFEVHLVVVDEVSASVWRDDDQRDSWAQAQIAQALGRHVIKEATEVVPGKKDGSVAPVLTAHDRIDYSHRPAFSHANRGRRMVALQPGC